MKELEGANMLLLYHDWQFNMPADVENNNLSWSFACLRKIKVCVCFLLSLLKQFMFECMNCSLDCTSVSVRACLFCS